MYSHSLKTAEKGRGELDLSSKEVGCVVAVSIDNTCRLKDLIGVESGREL